MDDSIGRLLADTRRRDDRLASREEVADFLQVPVTTLKKWAHERVGPRYRLVGRLARYEWVDVETWLASQKTGGAA